MAQVVDQLRAGREALAARRWREGYELLRAADAESPLEPADLESLASAAYFLETITEVVPLLERAYAGYVEAGDRRRAAFIATQLAHEYGSVRLQHAVGNGWLARAARLLADEPEGREHGYLELQRGLGALEKHDYVAAYEHGREAERIGREHGDRGLELRGQQRVGVALIHRGEVEEGKLLLDEVNIQAQGGGIEPYDTIVLYCNAIGTCRDVAAFDEASVWTERAEAFCDAYSVNTFPGMCRINRAEVMRFEGKLVDAEEAASEASRMLASWAPRIAAAAYAEVGEARLRLGDLAKAEEAFDQADDLGRDPEPGRSLLLLARDRPAASFASIRRTLADDTLSMPGRARLLPAFVEIAVAAGELDAAEAGAGELKAIAERYDTSALHAAAQLALGSVALAQGNADAAVLSLRRALRLWQDTNARYEASRTRVLLAHAYRETGDEHGAMHELARAGMVFDELGARIDSERVDGLLGRAGRRVTMTFVFTDIVDSTRHLEHFGDAGWQKLLRHHDELVRHAVKEAHGTVVDHTGDGFFLAFDEAEDAVSANRAILRAADVDLPFEIRVGIHTAEATSVGENYRGKGVHAAARIAAVAGPNEILASRASVEGIEGVEPGEARAVELKGFAKPVDVVAVGWR